MSKGVALFESLPGFRFAPTEYELVGGYLRRMVEQRDLGFHLIATVDLYKHDPWELPALAVSLPFMGEREWYFFVPRHHKYPNGSRPNRVTKSGYWKATGTDRAVVGKDNTTCIGLRKTLVFYQGKAPKGVKSSWIMNEYRLQDNEPSSFQNDITLCKIYRKGESSRNCLVSSANTSQASSPVSFGTRVTNTNAAGTSKVPAAQESPEAEEIQDSPGHNQADAQEMGASSASPGTAAENIMFLGFEDIDMAPEPWRYHLPPELQWRE